MRVDILVSDSGYREKLLRVGPAALSDAELLAVVLRTGAPGKTVHSVAQGLLEVFGGVGGLLHASPKQLAQHKGLGGAARRAELLAILELALRSLGQQLRAGEVFRTPGVVKNYLQLHLGRIPHEVFAVLFLDTQNRLIEMEVMFRGTLTQTSVYPREVVRRAMDHDASAVVFAHNHPSGEVEPSRADEVLTQTLREALALIDVRVLDHVIVSHGAALSMVEQGLV
ncbi:JAB domain-containing protein [Ramlibacter henchirensis]|uniref:JAB domain-containing protein n=1 Tax=Ramlibacter henchirensis TaxID=204072 RepID=A0A4Z0BVS8_9BURK|nr:DNA repair protein RadC [Ramlibacter henchirensis]TFZ02991.1 JAB domain-containing protein [Ramlibacter henchirensis]